MSETVHSSLKTAAKGTAFVFTGMMVSQALWFGTKLLIVRNLSKEDLGIYSLLVAIAGIVSLLACMGLCEGTTRYISILLGEGRRDDALSVQRSSLQIGATAGTVFFSVLFLLSGVLSRYVFYKPELAVPLMVMSLFIPADVMASVLTAVLRGYGVVSPKVYLMDVGQPFFFLIMLCAILFFNLAFISIIYAYVFSMVLICILIAVFAYTGAGIRLLPHADNRSGYAATLLTFSVPVLAMQFMTLLFRSVDTLMLGRYGPATDVGVYSVSVSLAVLLSLPLVALGFVYMPIAGNLYAKGRLSDLSRTYRVLTKWIFAVTLPMFFILFFFPEMTLSFLFGDRFGDAASPLRILSLGYLFTSFMGTNIVLLLVLGLSRSVVRVSALGAALDIVLNYILIKRIGLGIEGAALATSVSLVAVGCGYSFVLYRRSGIHPIASGYLKPAIGSAVIGVIIYAVAKSLPLYSWMLPIYFILYICGYIFSLVFSRSLDTHDALLFGEVLRRGGFAPEITKKVLEKIYRGNIENLDIR